MADQCKVSAAVNVAAEGSYVFKVDGYSRGKVLFKKGECTISPPFSVGGHNWVVTYYPNGYLATDAGSIVVALVLDSADAKNLKVRVRLGMPAKDGLPVKRLGYIDHIFLRKSSARSYTCQQAALERSAYLKDDSFNIMFDITVINNTRRKETIGNQFVVVPPSDLHQHFSNLLESMDGADVTFLVGGDKFLAHRLVLAARSSVFKAELLGAMKEKGDSLIEINEMEPHVFRCLLRFIYTDSLPNLEMACNKGEAHRDVVMASHLLVAADRYNIERLKLICEQKLCSHIDANMVATSLVLAEQHSCHGLKEACLRFLASPSNLQAMMASDGYEHLKSSCPSVLRELIARLLPIPLKAAEDILMAI